MESQDSIIKILDKLKFLEELRIDSQVLLLDHQDKDFKEISPLDIELILKMLEKEEIIEIHFYPSIFNERVKLHMKNSYYLDVEKSRCYQISVREKFDDFHNNLKSKVGRVSESKVKYLSDIKIPKGTKWEDIKIHFIDGHTVDISVQNKSYNKTYRELGFEDKRKHLPDKQWQLLELLANKKGELSWDDSNATYKVKQTKFRLSKRLRDIFMINDDPFYPYFENQGYRIKINISYS